MGHYLEIKETETAFQLFTELSIWKNFSFPPFPTPLSIPIAELSELFLCSGLLEQAVSIRRGVWCQVDELWIANFVADFLSSTTRYRMFETFQVETSNNGELAKSQLLCRLLVRAAAFALNFCAAAQVFGFHVA